GAFTFTLQAQDSVGNTRQRTFTLTVLRYLLGVSTGLPDGAVGEPYSSTLITFDNFGTTTWSITPGSSLPPGLTLSGGVISGTPTLANAGNGISYSFNLDATDSAGLVRTSAFILHVGSVRITNPQIIPTVAVVGSPFSYQFTSTDPGTTWTAGPLPAGYTLS